MNKILILAILLVSSNLFSQERKTTVDSTDFIVDVQPEFIGGNAAFFKFLSSNLRYPSLARAKSIEGAVYVGFVVDVNGSIVEAKVNECKLTSSYFDKKTKKLVNVKIEKDEGLQKESLRIVSLMPKWKPGSIKGKLVRVAYTLPIRFKLE